MIYDHSEFLYEELQAIQGPISDEDKVFWILWPHIWIIGDHYYCPPFILKLSGNLPFFLIRNLIWDPKILSKKDKIFKQPFMLKEAKVDHREGKVHWQIHEDVAEASKEAMVISMLIM